MTTTLQTIAPNVWMKVYPLKMLGIDLHRVVTVLRLASGKLIIHSTAPFTADDITEIQALGEPAWIIDTLLRHDTFAVDGRKAFPHAEYLAPVGFSKDLPFPTANLIPSPLEWSDEIDVVAIDGAPEFGEIVLCHRPSRTLIVADLVFNFPQATGWWTKFFLKAATIGWPAPGMTLPFKKAIKALAAFAESIQTILSWDFDRIIVGHGSPVETDGKAKLRAAIQAAGIKL